MSDCRHCIKMLKSWSNRWWYRLKYSGIYSIEIDHHSAQRPRDHRQKTASDAETCLPRLMIETNKTTTFNFIVVNLCSKIFVRKHFSSSDFRFVTFVDWMNDRAFELLFAIRAMWASAICDLCVQSLNWMQKWFIWQSYCKCHVIFCRCCCCKCAAEKVYLQWVFTGGCVHSFPLRIELHRIYLRLSCTIPTNVVVFINIQTYNSEQLFPWKKFFVIICLFVFFLRSALSIWKSENWKTKY